jgi:hypothetical protein
LRSILAGTARRLADESVASQGGGVVSLAGAAAAQIASDTTSLAFGNARRIGWHRWQKVVVRNTSIRPLRVRLRVARYADGATLVRVQAAPSQFTIRPGQERLVQLVAFIGRRPVGNAPAEGSVVFAPSGGAPLVLPWAVTFVEPPGSMLGPLDLSDDAFSPSDATPALLRFRAGRLVSEGGRDAVEPVAELRLQLLRADGRDFGTLVTLRDLLPGRYEFGLTGRSSAGNALARGRYRLRVTAVPSLRGPPSVASVDFTIN